MEGTSPRRRCKSCSHSQMSESDSSEVTGFLETRKALIGEVTGEQYSRIQTKAQVTGKSKDEMLDRVSKKMKVMRKNSIRFSRGMDLRVTRYVELAQQHLQNSSGLMAALLSTALSLLRLAIVLPLRVLMYLIGARQLTRRSRSVRSESMKRRRPPITSPSDLPPPSSLRQSAEPIYEEQSSLRNLNTIVESSGQDSGIQEGIDDEKPQPTASKIPLARQSGVRQEEAVSEESEAAVKPPSEKASSLEVFSDSNSRSSISSTNNDQPRKPKKKVTIL